MHPLALHIKYSLHTKVLIHYGYFDPLLIIHLKPEKINLFKIVLR